MLIFKRSHTHINQATLSEYLDGRIQGSAAARVDRQLAGCATCQQELDSLRSTVSLLRRMSEAPIPRSFTFPGPPPVVVAARPFMPLRMPQWAYASAAGVVALVLAVLVSADATGMLAPDAVPVAGETASVAPPVPQAFSLERAEAVVESAAAPEEAVSLAASPEAGVDVAAPKAVELSRPLAPPLQGDAERPTNAVEEEVQSAVAAEAEPIAALAVAEQPATRPTAAIELSPKASQASTVPPARDEKAEAQRQPVAKDPSQQPPKLPQTPATEAGPESQATSAPTTEPVGTGAVWRVLEGLAAAALVAFVAGWLIRRRQSPRHTRS